MSAHIDSLMQHFTDQGAQGKFTRLYLMELANSTGLIHNIWHKLIAPRRQALSVFKCKFRPRG